MTMRIVIEPGWVSVRKIPDIDALADRVGIQYGQIEETVHAGNKKDGNTVTRTKIVLFREHARINLGGDQLMIVRRSDIIGEYLPDEKAK
jgi:hypothetical protein